MWSFLSDSAATEIYRQFLQAEMGCTAERLAFLDRGVEQSPYGNELPVYGDRLKQKPHLPNGVYQDYPVLGGLPTIDEEGLSFLHPDIKHACVVVGGWHGGHFQAQWWGRNALEKVQFWSATKILPLLNTLTQLSGELDELEVGDGEKRYPLVGLIEDLMNYRERYGSSNAIAALLKCFTTYAELETWVKDLTGQTDLNFQGLYGEEPLISLPQILRQGKTILSAIGERKSRGTQPGENLMTAYALTRILSMVGWHHHLPEVAQIPGLDLSKLGLFVESLGKDCARFVDVAIAQLNLDIQNPVILSKMGFGYSDSRCRSEMTYTCFVQFEYQHHLQSLTLTFRAARALGDPDQEARELDARMATEITETIRRLVASFSYNS